MNNLKFRVKWLMTVNGSAMACDYFYCSCLKRLQVHLKHKVKPTGQANTILSYVFSTYFPTLLVQPVRRSPRDQWKCPQEEGCLILKGAHASRHKLDSAVIEGKSSWLWESNAQGRANTMLVLPKSITWWSITDRLLPLYRGTNRLYFVFPKGSRFI